MKNGLIPLAFVMGSFVLGAVATVVVAAQGQSGSAGIGGGRIANAEAGSMLVSASEADVRRTPVSDSLHFDLACNVRGRVVWQDDPTRPILSPNPQQWDDHPRLIVDLETMRFCDQYECMTRGPKPIESVSPHNVTFVDRPGRSETFHRAEGRYAMAAFELGRFQVTEGSCTVEPFSGFPPPE